MDKKLVARVVAKIFQEDASVMEEIRLMSGEDLYNFTGARILLNASDINKVWDIAKHDIIEDLNLGFDIWEELISEALGEGFGSVWYWSWRLIYFSKKARVGFFRSLSNHVSFFRPLYNYILIAGEGAELIVDKLMRDTCEKLNIPLTD